MSNARNGFSWVAVLALVLAAGLAVASLAVPLPAVALPLWAAAVAPLACLAAGAVIGRGQTRSRRVTAGLLALAAFGLVTAAQGAGQAMLQGLPLEAAALDAFVAGPAAVTGVLAAVALVGFLAPLLFLRQAVPQLRAAAPRTEARTEPAREPRIAERAPASARPAPRIPHAAPARPAGPLAPGPSGGSFARPAARHDSRPGPKVTRAPEAPEPAPGPKATSVASIAAPPAAPRRPAPVAATRGGGQAGEAVSPPQGSPAAFLRPAPGGGWKRGTGEPVVRVSFGRVADQIPIDALTVGREELAGGLAEPGVLVVPRRLLASQLGEGLLQVAWEDVADQFPSGALAVPAAALGERMAGGLLLPLDEVVMQFPREAFAVAAPVVDISGIEEFPSPFSFGPDDAQLEVRTAAVVSTARPEPPSSPPPVAPREVSLRAVEPPTPAWGDIALGPAAEAPVRPADTASAPTAAAGVASGTATLRISFDRLALQLPPGSFQIPVERVSANLLEPGCILIARRLVEPQIAEGVVAVAWGEVASQFPPQCLALTAEEMNARLPGGALTLPLDEVVAQLSPELFAMPSARPDLRALEAFPEPFQAEPSPSAPPAPAASAGAAGSQARPDAGTGSPRLAPGAPADGAGPGRAGARLPADSAAALTATRPHMAERIAVAERELVLEDEPQAAPLEPMAAPGAPLVDVTVPRAGATAAPGLEELAGALAAAGPFEPAAHRVGERPFFTFTAPGMRAPDVRVLAERLAEGLAAAPPSWAPEQATVRCAGGALVLTPIGRSPAGDGRPAAVLAVAVPRGGSLARVELACLEARRDRCGQFGSGPAGSALEHDESAPTDAAAAVARNLDAFGPVAAHVRRNAGGDLRVYLYAPAGEDVSALASFARALDEAAADSPAPLGALESVACRAARGRVALRIVPAATRARTLLVVAGHGQARSGLAHLQVERAATHLSTL